jgi:hypothetical protein
MVTSIGLVVRIFYAYMKAKSKDENENGDREDPHDQPGDTDEFPTSFFLDSPHIPRIGTDMLIPNRHSRRGAR